MNNNPKRSKALIITVVIVVLLVGAVLLLRKSGSFGTQAGGLSKIFAPLLGTGKQKTVDTIDNNSSGDQNQDQGTGTDDENQGGTSGGIDTGGSNNQVGTIGTTGSITAPAPKPLPVPGTNSNGSEDQSGGETEPIKVPPPPPQPTEDPIKICQSADDFPLEYTQEEKDELAELLRQYYLIAPELKTAGEVALLENDINRNQSLIDHADILTGQCKEQKADPKYAGQRAVKNNPYYVDLNIRPEFYAPKEYNTLEDAINIW